MTKKEAISLLEGESIRCRMALKINGCQMTEDWKRTIEVCEIAIEAIKAQEQRRWIPVTERLPEFGERVLCTDGVAVFEQYRVELSCVYGMWDRFGMKSPMQEVTHWMPLPEPPKGE